MRTFQEYIAHAPFVFMVVIAILQVLSGNQSGRHTYVVRYKHGDSLIPVTVVLDYKRQTEYVINMNSRSPAKSMTLYDFKERVIAYKDLKNGECFIGRLTHETIQDEDAVLKRLKNPVESEPLILSLEPDRPSLTPTEVRNMVGHKAAVFCRRMNTWTLMPEKSSRRERRDTLRHLDKSSALREDHQKSNRVLLQRSEVFKTEQDNIDRNRSNRDISSSQSNGSFSATHLAIDRSDTAPSLLASTADISIQHQRLNNGYPFILPRQKISVENKEERGGSIQNFSIYNTTRKTVDDSFLSFGFARERSDLQPFSEFSQSRPSGSGNGTSLISSTKRTFISLNPNHPVIIPSINFPSKSPEDKMHGNHDINQISSPNVLPGGYPQSANNFHTSHNRDEILDIYSPLHQLPPEAFVLPLTRPSPATTASPFIFSNRLGYEIVHPDKPSIHNDTDPLNGLESSLNESVDNFRSVLTVKSDKSALDLGPSSVNILDNREVPANIPSVPLHSNNRTWNEGNEISVSAGNVLNHPGERKSFYVDSYIKQLHMKSHDKSANETGKTHSKANASSISRFDDTDSSTDRSDSPIQVPRWYPEIAKQISIPLEIEVLHHQEEYAHGISNRTEQVHSVRSHEVEDLSSRPNANTIIPIPVETHSTGVRHENEVKLLPQISGIPSNISSREIISQALGRQDQKIDRRPEPTEFSENSYPIYRGTNNLSLQEIFPNAKPTPGPLLTNDTEVIDSVRSLSIGSVPVFGDRQNFVNQISHPTPSYKETFEDTGRTPKKHHFNEGTLPVHDFKIDEGVPSYRKRFPAVSQLFAPDETVSDVGRLPDQHFRLSHQNPHRRRKPSTSRNKTHSIPPRGYETKAAWRKHNLASRNLINRPQTRFSDQGITFHHRGHVKPGVPGIPYDHHRKRLGLLPPGVSVHPRHPQAPYADFAAETAGKTIPENPLLHSRPRRIHLRHHRRHQRKRNRIPSSPDLGTSATNCCSGDSHNCCSSRRRGRDFSKTGCCSQSRESRRRNLLLPSQADKNEVSSRKKVEEVAEDRCMKEKMCRTVYQSAKKVLVCRNIPVEGC